MELLFHLRKTSTYHDETVILYKKMKELQNKHNLRIDSFILDEDDFYSLMRSYEINPLREALANKITFFCPQAFWSEIKKISEETEIRTLRKETRPTEFSELGLVYNLSRFGYKEFGSTLEQGREYCIEYLTTALLLLGDTRRLEAIPIILAKNSFKSNVLAFLSQKFGLSGKLLGLLKILRNMRLKSEIDETIEIMEALKVEEISADERSILQKMRLYNAA
jgi:hypothetical protein